MLCVASLICFGCIITLHSGHRITQKLQLKNILICLFFFLLWVWVYVYIFIHTYSPLHFLHIHFVTLNEAVVKSQQT